MVYLIEDNGYDAQNVYEYTEEDFTSILHTGKYGGCVIATDTQKEVMKGTYVVIRGNELTLEQIKKIKETGELL